MDKIKKQQDKIQHEGFTLAKQRALQKIVTDLDADANKAAENIQLLNEAVDVLEETSVFESDLMTQTDTNEILIKLGQTPFREIPCTFQFLESGAIAWADNNHKYSLNGADYVNFVKGNPVEVKEGDVFVVRPTNYNQTTFGQHRMFDSSARFNVFGNISSLYRLDWTPESEDVAVGTHTFESIFSGLRVVSAKNLILPSYVMSESHYLMFGHCSDLVVGPELSAVAIDPHAAEQYRAAHSCYFCMFLNCTSLKEAPAPKLPNGIRYPARAYEGMFRGCTSLVSADFDLPFETLDGTNNYNCYNQMFWGCTSLVKAPRILATSVVEQPAGTYKNKFLNDMFNGCSSLTEVTCLLPKFDDIVSENWLAGVAETGVLRKNPNLNVDEIPRNANGAPEGWEIVDSDIVNN